MERHRTVVLLPPAGAPDHEAALGTLRGLKGAAKDALLVPLGYSPLEELSSTAAVVRHPEDFLDRNLADNIDSEALRLARSWYGPLGDELVFEGVNLAQMCEYWFYFVFVDCLRSIEIASRLLREVLPEQIILPRTIMAHEISEICYESLPKAFKHLAGSSGAKIEPLSKMVEGPRGRIARQSQLNKGRFYQRSLELVGPLARQKAVFLYGIYANDLVAEQVKNHGLRPHKLVPYAREDATTQDFSETLDGLRKRWIKMVTRESASTKPETAAMAIALDRFDEFFGQVAPELAKHVAWARHFSKRLRPRIVLAMEDITPMHRSIARVLKTNGAQVVVLQHGLLTKDMAGYYLMPIEGDVQAVWGEYYVDWHVKRGKDPSALAVTGSPNYEGLTSDARAIEETKASIGIDGARPVLLIGTSRYSGISSVNTVEKEERFFDGVYGGLAEETRYQIITKMHPGCGASYFSMAEDVARRYSVRTQLTKEHLRELLALCSVVVMPTSTIGYEAVLLKKPMVCVDFEGQREASVFVEGGVGVGVIEQYGLVKGIEAAVKLVSSQPYVQARSVFLERHLNGDAPSSNIAALVKERYKMGERAIRSHNH